MASKAEAFPRASLALLSTVMGPIVGEESYKTDLEAVAVKIL
jgi:hypothetical protein